MGSNERKHRLLKILLLAIQLYTPLSASVPGSDPCNNFYEYACENPAKDPEYVSLIHKAQSNVVTNLKHVIQSINSSSNLEVFKKWQTFYASCGNTESINNEGITPINSILNNFGGWPSPNSPDADLSKLLEILSFYSKLKVFPLYKIEAHDDKFHKKTKIRISQPETTFLEGIEKASQSDVVRYTNFIKRIIEIVASSNQVEISQVEVDNVARQIVAFENELSKILSSRHETHIYKPTGLKDFQDNTNQDIVNWKNIINGLTTAELVTDEDKIDVLTNSFYPKLFKLLQETPVRTTLNYVHWRFVIEYLPYTSDNLRSLYFENKDLLQNPVQESSRSNACVFEPVLDSILSYQYAKEYITPEIEASVHQILTNVKQAAIEIIQESSLLKDGEKEVAENKVSNMKFVFGILENEKNFATISEFYNSWVVSENYFDNILTLRRFTTVKELEKIKENDFIDNSASTFMRVTKLLDYGFNYEILDNTVYIKPENLVSPLFSPKSSDVEKYGLLGFTIARSIMMAFESSDSVESYMDGRFKKLYSYDTQEAYWNRSDCFFNQLITTMQINNSDDPQDTAIPIMYNMADTTAIHIAYKAFLSKQTDSESASANAREFFTLFVKLVCQPELQEFSSEWSLGLTKPQYRVMGSLPNVRQFAQAFTCPQGVQMNPEKTCSFLK